ncbi:MPO1, partial [Symbiodinium sp. KB8]
MAKGDKDVTKGMSLLERNFCAYAEYHWDPINQWIHIIFVPCIFWSAAVMLGHVSPVVDKVAPELAQHFPLGGVFGDNLSLLPLVLYASFYVILGFSDGKAWLGFLAASMITGLVAAANVFLTQYSAPESMPFATVWNVAIALHIFGWAVQFYGHGVHEGRSPALLDNLFQAIFAAPIFVLMEVLMKLGFLLEFKGKVASH